MTSVALPPLHSFASNTYSQCGEDGILREMLRRIGTAHQRDFWCVEVGAWDGVVMSNTARLIREERYRAVLIEGNGKRAAQLTSAHPDAEVIARCALVQASGANRLDALLASTPVPSGCDVLSIDIDSFDYQVWESLSDYHPKVVVIEHNLTIPNELIVIQHPSGTPLTGSSAAAFVGLARRKGYVLAAVTEANVIFVAERYATAVLGSDRPTLTDLRDDSAARCLLYQGFDGSLHTSAPVDLYWLGNFRVSQRKLQVLPRMLRGFDDHAVSPRRWAARTWVNPSATVQRAARVTRAVLTHRRQETPPTGGQPTSH